MFPYDALTVTTASVATSPETFKIDELLQRIHRYLNVPPTAPLAQLPIGEAMLTCHDENSQLFIPFVYVRIQLKVFFSNFGFSCGAIWYWLHETFISENFARVMILIIFLGFYVA